MNPVKVPFDKAMIVRTAIMIFALVNQFLVNTGYSPLTFDDHSFEVAVTTTLTIASMLWVWWKNNNITYRAHRNEKYLNDQGLK